MDQATKNWYAVKVFFNKVFEMEDRLAACGVETYLAVEKMLLKGEAHLAAARRLALTAESGAEDPRYIREGALIYLRRPMVTSLLFVRASDAEILSVNALLDQRDTSGRVYGFIYRDTSWKHFSVIPDHQMAVFRLVTQTADQKLEFYTGDDVTRFRKGTKVRVTDGPFKGAEGYVRRIRKDRRLVVCIEGVIAVATSYIPSQNLAPIPE